MIEKRYYSPNRFKVKKKSAIIFIKNLSDKNPQIIFFRILI